MGRVVYVAGSRLATVTFNAGSGTFVVRQNSVTTGSLAAADVVHASERFLHAQNFSGVTTSLGSEVDGRLSNSFFNEIGDAVVAIDPANRFVFAQHGYPSGLLTTYLFDAGTNRLRRIASLDPERSFRALAVDSTGRFLLAACHCSNPGPDVFAYAINRATGGLTLAGSVDAFALETHPAQPLRMALHRNGAFFYVSGASTEGFAKSRRCA